jgi:hypothetical protein
VTPLSDGPEHEPRPTAPDGAVPGGVPGAVGAGAAGPPQLSLVEDDARRYPSTIGGAFYLVVLLVTVLALVVVGLGHWRGGVHILGGAMVAAAGARAFLRRRDLGMLEVRSRWFDVVLLAAVGVALWVLASTIPAQG